MPVKVWDGGCDLGTSGHGARGAGSDGGTSKSFWKAAKILFVHVLLVTQVRSLGENSLGTTSMISTLFYRFPFNEMLGEKVL